MLTSTDMLDRLLDPVGRALSPEAARRLVALRADPDAQAKIDDLADLANDGQLTPDQRAEYESLIVAANVIAVLQAKARTVLSDTPRHSDSAWPRFFAISSATALPRHQQSPAETADDTSDQGISFLHTRGIKLNAPQTAVGNVPIHKAPSVSIINHGH